MKAIILTIILFLQLLSFGSFSQNKSDSVLVDRIDGYLNESVENGFAASILVAKEGEILLSKGYGWANRSMKVPNASTTRFNIGSVSKQFTAAAILKLMENGQLNVTDSIGYYFPEAPADKQGITIHQLLTHTSGVSPQTGGFRYDSASKEQFQQEFFQAGLMYAPGLKHTYANANYILLAAIIEKVSAQDYETFLRERFWEPLGMDHTGYKTMDFDSSQCAHGYEFQISTGKWEDWGITQEHLPETNNHWYSIGKGDIYSTVEDLYTWHLALEEHKILKKESKELMESPLVPENEAGTSHYGYGWAIFKAPNGTKIVTHNGSNRIFFADFIRNVDEGTVVIVLSNVILNQQSGFVGWEIARMILNSSYNPKVIPKNNYELVFTFMESHEPEGSGELLDFMSEESGVSLKDKAVLNRIGFTLVAENLHPEWGIALLKLNTSIFSDDGNLWDTLGEAYFLLEDEENARKSFQKALELQPENNCYWCENASSRLNMLNSSGSDPKKAKK